jgi:hypothetical protein
LVDVAKAHGIDVSARDWQSNAPVNTLLQIAKAVVLHAREKKNRGYFIISKASLCCDQTIVITIVSIGND